MKCDSKTMLKLVAGLGIALALAYVALPAVRAFVLTSAPILVALVCPIVMLIMMVGMNASKKDERTKPDESQVRPEVHDVGADKA